MSDMKLSVVLQVIKQGFSAFSEIASQASNLRGNLDSVAQGFQEVKSAVQEATSSLEKGQSSLERFGQTLTRAGGALSIGITAPLLGLGKGAFDAAVQMDSLQRGLTAVTGNAKATEQQMTRIREIAKLPGLGIREAAQEAVALEAAGMKPDQALSTLKAFGNALATVGKGKADLQDTINALVEMQSLGKPEGRQMMMLSIHVPQIRQAVKAAFGTADTEALAKSGITSDQFIAKVTEQLGKLKQVTDGPRNDLENLQDTIFLAMDRIGKAILPLFAAFVDKVAPAIEALSNAFQSLPGPVQTGIVVLAGLVAAVGPVLLVLGQLANGVAAVGKAIEVLGPIAEFAKGPLLEMAASAMAALLPILPYVVAIGAALAAMILICRVVKDNWDGIKAAIQSVIDAIKAFLSWIGQIASALNPFHRAQSMAHEMAGGGEAGASAGTRAGGGRPGRRYLVEVHADGSIAKESVDERINQFARGWAGANVYAGT